MRPRAWVFRGFTLAFVSRARNAELRVSVPIFALVGVRAAGNFFMPARTRGGGWLVPVMRIV